jgi:hypothetical protein
LRKRIFEYLLQCSVFLIDLGRVRVSVDVPKTTKAEHTLALVVFLFEVLAFC